MGLSQVNQLSFFIYFIIAIGIPSVIIPSEPLSFNSTGRILFLIQQGHPKEAIEIYRQNYKEIGEHDFDLLHKIGLGIVHQGFHQDDPESQLLSLFGASVSAHEEAYPVIEESLQSRYPQIQLVALQALSRLQNDRADKAIMKALGSNHLIIRLEAVHQLCLKKHPQAVFQAESLMYKTPKELLPVYAQLYAMLGTTEATRLLRRLLNDPSEGVRTAVILNIAKYKRDDLLPQLRQQGLHFGFSQQEACAFALGTLKDEKSIPTLQKIAKSQYPCVALVAQLSLYKLGQKDSIASVEKMAKEGNLFAIAALGDIPEAANFLIELCSHDNLQVRINATIALMQQGNKACFNGIKDLLIRHRLDYAFVQTASPGKTLTSWKGISSASSLLKEDIEAYLAHIQFKEAILEKIRTISEDDFLVLADAIFAAKQHDLVPQLSSLLEDMATPQTIDLLKKYQKQYGSPLVRNYCNLALYRLHEPGPYGELLKQWVKSQSNQMLIQLRPPPTWVVGKSSYEFTPEETSRLLVESFEAFTMNQDDTGIDALLDAIAYGNQKNKYALAGLLIRATQ